MNGFGFVHKSQAQINTIYSLACEYNKLIFNMLCNTSVCFVASGCFHD